MKACVNPQGTVVGYFLDAQLPDGEAGLSRYGLAGNSLIEIDEAAHAACMEAQAGGSGAYVQNGAVLPRPKITAATNAEIAADGVQEHRATGLPDGAEVYVDGQLAGTVSGGEFVMVTDTPGTYEVRVSLWPFMDMHYTVEGV